MNLRPLIVTSLLIGLFVMAIIGFGVQIGLDNGVSSSILENPAINETYSDIQAELEDVQSTAQGQRESFEGEVPTEADDSFLFGSIISAGKVFTGTLRNVFNIVFTTIATTLGVNRIVLGTITAILLITIIFLAWRVYKVGY